MGDTSAIPAKGRPHPPPATNPFPAQKETKGRKLAEMG